MSQQISLYIDVQNRQLVRSDSTSIPTTLPDVFQGDTLGLYLEFLNATGSNAAPYTDIDYSAAAVTVAIGTIGAQPTAGNFTITDTAATQTTANIAFNATASAVQTAIQAALTTNWASATVTGNAGGPYTITNGANGAETALVGSSVSLTPAGFVSIGTIQTGTGSLPQIQYVEVLQSPIALQDTWTAYPAPTATVTQLQAGSGTQNEIQQITLGNNPYAGAFVVNFGSQTSNPIQWNASPAAVQTALLAMSSIGSGNVSVGGSAGAWVVTFTGSLALASQSLMTTVASGLVGPLALTGSLSLNTAAIEEAIGETASITETFAIKVTPSGGNAFTCLQEQITIYNDLIVGAPSIPTPGVSYYTETEADALFLTFTGDGTGVMFPGLLSIASGKTLTASHTLTLTGTDGSTLNIGTGGTLGAGAFSSGYTLPDATTSALGGVIIGTGLNVTSGTVTADIGGTVQAHSSVLDTLAGTTFDSSVLSAVPNIVNQNSGLVALDSSGNLLYPATSTALADNSGDLNYSTGNTLADSSGFLYYNSGTTLANATGSLYSTVTSGKIMVSGGSGSPITGLTIGTGLTNTGTALAVASTWANAFGTNTYTATISSVVTYTTGMIVTVTFANANTGASTLNINSLGAQPIVFNGSALASGQIQNSSAWSLVFDGTEFQLIN